MNRTVTATQLLDWSAAAHAELARRGDLDAAQMLHSILADYLEASGELPPAMRQLLAVMHRQIANGADAANAMLTAAHSNRRIKTTDHECVANEVLAELVIANIYDANRATWTAQGHKVPSRPSKEEIYRRVAKRFGATPANLKARAATVKDIFKKSGLG